MSLNASLEQYTDPNLVNSFWRQLGVNGSNPGRQLARRNDVGLGLRSLAQTAFGNTLEPKRQAAIKGLMALLDPANAQGRIDAFNRGAQSRAYETGRNQDALLQSLGLSSGAREGSALSALNMGNRQTTDFANSLFSNQGQTAAYQGLLQAIGAGQDPSLAQLLAQLSGMMQQSNVATTPKQASGLGSLLGVVGQLAGQGAFNGLFGGAGNSGLMNMSQSALAGY